ncbi:YkgJ family cysteine cluster protein [Desulfobotulus sp. H1]|uniref:YkgJ family cysteine cluster protein n=1 Tax=Desulfobotulus pelophilus TaxID=2823377 RepID=A0ABT3NCU3_9BACT|nr:YkgJ family cysteine cluster protein [Desulfobotulus pelophilus]MCW7755011.1 YkgJ family cysteine cluster protein [Desulfobotulus pelophilus]
MDPASRLLSLKELYHLQAAAFQPYQTACKPGCSSCCTRNVVITSLEADFIIQGMSSDNSTRLQSAFLNQPALLRLQPRITMNTMASLYMEGEEPQEDAADPAWWPCPLMDTDQKTCLVYEYRPMACRCMVSKINCETSGAADMEEGLVILHTLFLQLTEHLDANGRSASLLDLLMERLFPGSVSIPMPENRKIPMLMIPGSWQQKLRPLLEEIQSLFTPIKEE